MRQDDNPDVFDAAIQANPFHTELPIYWSNCHRNPNSDPFQMRYIINAHAANQLERFVHRCTARTAQIRVRSVMRI